MKEIKPLIPVNPKGLDEIAQALLNEAPLTSSEQDNLVNVKANINKADYIRIPNTNILISRQEIYKGKTWQNTIYKLTDNGLFMPNPSLFMPYLLNVKNASERKITLYDGNNNPISPNEIEDLWKYLTTGHKGGCWTWLDALFKEENGKWYIYTNHKVIKKGNNKELQGTKSLLEQCLREDCYVNLDFNKQGLPKTRANNQHYQQGDNIRYLHPRNGTVAGFSAVSGRAYLNYFGNPGVSSAGLGVFACARGK